MSTCASLFEERVMDQQTGRVLNADMEFYHKLSGIGDIRKRFWTAPGYFARKRRYAPGIIGLGEPPAIGGMAAISNAVANAIGVRVGILPLTPDRVLAALGTMGGNALKWNASNTPSPSTVKRSDGAAGHSSWNDAPGSGRRHGLLISMIGEGFPSPRPSVWSTSRTFRNWEAFPRPAPGFESEPPSRSTFCR